MSVFHLPAEEMNYGKVATFRRRCVLCSAGKPWTLVYVWMMHCCRHLFMLTIANSSEPLTLEVFRNGLKDFKVLTWPWTYPIQSVICGMCWNVHPSIFFCIPMPGSRGLLPKQKGPTFPQPPPPVYPEVRRDDNLSSVSCTSPTPHHAGTASQFL